MSFILKEMKLIPHGHFKGVDDMKIVLQDEKKCWYTDCTYNLHKHHIFNGPLRKKSERYGLTVWIRADLHNGGGPDAVHSNEEKNMELKKIGQRAFEEVYGHDKFMQEFHKNYL